MIVIFNGIVILLEPDCFYIVLKIMNSKCDCIVNDRLL